MTAVAKETRARGAQHTLAPVVDVMRDARWGRAEETYGEDPYLVDAHGRGGGARPARRAQGRQEDRQQPRDGDAEALRRPRPAGVGHQRRPRQPLGAGDPRGLLPAVRGGDQGGGGARGDARLRRDRRRARAREQAVPAGHPAQGMGLRRADRVRLLRGRAAQVAAFRRRQRRGRGAAGAGVGRRPGAARPEDVPAAARAGEVEGDPDRGDRQVGGARAARQVRPRPVRAAVHRRRAGGQDRGLPPNTRRWRARRPTDRSSC